MDKPLPATTLLLLFKRSSLHQSFRRLVESMKIGAEAYVALKLYVCRSDNLLSPEKCVLEEQPEESVA